MQNFTNYEIAKTLDELSDNDFYEVMLELGKMNRLQGKIIENREDFIKWLDAVLYEIEAENEDYDESIRITKEQAITEHRKMWNWIADETEKRQQIVNKTDYFEEHENEFSKEMLKTIDSHCNCFCCLYNNTQSNSKDGKNCNNCPLEWESEVSISMCSDSKEENDECGLYSLWQNSDYSTAAELARKIANLPEKKKKHKTVWGRM